MEPLKLNHENHHQIPIAFIDSMPSSPYHTSSKSPGSVSPTLRRKSSNKRKCSTFSELPLEQPVLHTQPHSLSSIPINYRKGNFAEIRSSLKNCIFSLSRLSITEAVAVQASSQTSLDEKLEERQSNFVEIGDSEYAHQPNEQENVENRPDIYVINGNFSDYYELHEVLGVGTSGTVKKGVNNKTDKNYAVKIVPYHGDDERLMLLTTEFANHRKLDHKNIISVYEMYIDNSRKTIYTIMELAEGREMFEVIGDLGHYNEEVASSIFKQILNGINYLHSHGVCHRDLKPNNILVSNDGKHVKIADFNVSKFIEKTGKKYSSFSPSNYKMWTNTGTPSYKAPEFYTEDDYQYTEAVDMWSAGVVLYFMLSGHEPFKTDSFMELCEMITKGDYELESEPWDSISKSAKDLVKGCLNINPKTRLKCSDALIHDWISNVNSLPLNSLKRFKTQRTQDLPTKSRYSLDLTLQKTVEARLKRWSIPYKKV